MALQAEPLVAHDAFEGAALPGEKRQDVAQEGYGASGRCAVLTNARSKRLEIELS